MDTKFVFKLFLCVFLLSNCSQLTVYQTARTEGKRNLTITPMIEGTSQIPRSSGGGSSTAPGARVELNYGLSEKLDISASVSSAGSLLSSLKYQVLGSNESPFALAVMPGYEYQVSPNGGGEDVRRLHFPIILSYYTSENLGFFASPKYALQIQEGSENTSFPGFSAGINIDRPKVQYIIGAGGFIPITTRIGSNESLFQFGISARIPIYRN